MTIPFYKYQGTGNDFILIDNRSMVFKNDTKLIERLCNRKFGIGADGLILLETPENGENDFRMVYFNADGNESSMCGNGGRCVVDFANKLGVIAEKTSFSAIDGEHKAILEDGLVRLQMQDVPKITQTNNAYFLDTGSPHHVVFTSEVKKLDVKKEGAKIRNNETYKEKGVNVNFASLDAARDENCFFVRTFERGVEDETLSCGTGVTAVALAAHFSEKTSASTVFIETLGGKLSVSFEVKGSGSYENIWLNGPVEMVFKGEITC